MIFRFSEKDEENAGKSKVKICDQSPNFFPVPSVFPVVDPD
jgi:hypothetical protein